MTTRRGLIGGVIAGGVALAGGLGWWLTRPPPSLRDGLADQLGGAGANFGAAARASLRDFDARKAAAELAAHGAARDLESLAVRDAAQGRVIEVKGWVVPRSVAAAAAILASPE